MLQGSLFTLLLKFKQSNGQFEVWQVISYNFLYVDTNMFSHHLCVFTLTEASACRQTPSSSVDKDLLQNIIHPWGTPLELYSDGEVILLARCFDKSVLFN